jgi:hypothetical protein
MTSAAVLPHTRMGAVAGLAPVKESVLSFSGCSILKRDRARLSVNPVCSSGSDGDIATYSATIGRIDSDIQRAIPTTRASSFLWPTT